MFDNSFDDCAEPKAKKPSKGADDKESWQDEETKYLIAEAGEQRRNGVFSRPGTWEVSDTVTCDC